MKVEFKNHLTLRTVPSKMSKLQIACSVFTWMLVIGFCIITVNIFTSTVGPNDYDALFANSLMAWSGILVAAVVCSFIIDIKEKIINIGSFMWLAFLVYIVTTIVGKL